ncbi:hypothetical protein ACOMHN_060657 [Nucella lapillus]
MADNKSSECMSRVPRVFLSDFFLSTITSCQSIHLTVESPCLSILPSPWKRQTSDRRALIQREKKSGVVSSSEKKFRAAAFMICYLLNSAKSTCIFMSA